MSSTCHTCGVPLEDGDRYVFADGGALHVHCSHACLRESVRTRRRQKWADRRRHARTLLASLTLASTGFMPHGGPAMPGPKATPVPITHAKPTRSGLFGPPWPPTELDWTEELAEDAWIHPLPGPIRRMPLRDSRVFGAERPGDRPIECRSGHCGVDLGGEIWGEHVFAAHDGVVDRVQRGPNDEHGGMYVRIAHRGGTVFTQYFHLAAIARNLAPGVHVKAGDVIGLLGDSGVKDSTAHLHFTISVKPSPEWPERYMDPEPLIAIWPLRIPIDQTGVGLVTTMSPVAAPLGQGPPKAGKRHAAARKPVRNAAAKADKAEKPAADEATGAPATSDE